MLRGRLVCLAVLLTATSAGAATPAGGACSKDADCELRTICTQSACTPLPARRSVIPFYFHQPGDVGYRHISPLLYFHTWDREGSTRVQFPFFATSESYAKQTRLTVVPLLLTWREQSPTEDHFAIFPLLWHTRYIGHGSTTTLFPLLYLSHYDQRKTVILAPLLSGGRRDDARDLTEALIGLVGYYRREKQDVWRVLFPLFFDHETATTHTTLAPLFWFRRNGPRSTLVLFPLLWHLRNTERGTEHLTLLPLFDYDREQFGRRERLISILGAWDKDEDAGLKQLILVAPPLFYRRDPKRDVDVLPPIFTRWQVHDDGSSGVIAGPIFRATDPEGATTALVPIYWRFEDKHGGDTHILFPIAGWHKHPGAAGAVVGPFYGWSSSNGAGGWGAGLAPLAFFGRSGERRHAVLLPLFAHFSDGKAGTATTAVGPIFHHRTRDGWDAGLLPLFYVGRHADRTYGLVPPLVWHFGDKDGTTDVFGPLYVKRGTHGWAGGLAPLLFFGKSDTDEHQVVAPIFFRFVDRAAGTERMLIGPFYHGREGATTTDVLFPLLYLRRAPDAGLLVTPLGGWSKDPKRGTETVVVGPYWQQRNDKKHSKTRWFFPLGVVHDAPSYSVAVQFPFYWRVHDGSETDTVVFPFYWRIRSPRMTLDGIFPLGVHARTDVATTTVIGPVWSRTRNDGGRSAGLFPLAAYGKSVKDGETTRWFGMPGAFWFHTEKTGLTRLVAGPFFATASPGAYTAGLFPLAFAWRRETRSHVLAPLFYHLSDVADDHTLTVLGPLYFGHHGVEKRGGLIPLFFFHSDKDSASATLFPIAYFEKKKVGSILATLPFGWSTYDKGWRAWVGPFYLRRDNEASSTALWPLVYFTHNKVTGATVKMALPFLFDGRADDGRQLAMYSPLVWRYHSIERSIHVGLPAFFDVNSFGESRTTGLLPLFVRNHSHATQATNWVFPPLLAWARTRPNGPDAGTDVVLFPLIWRFGGQNSTTVLAPLFWDFKRGESRTTLALPVVAFWRRNDVERTVVFNMYYRRGVKSEEGSWHCYIIPITDFGRPRKQDVEWNFLFGLVGYARQGRNRTLRLFFRDIPLEPVPASSLSWFGSTPTSARTW